MHGAVSVPSLHTIELQVTDQRMRVKGFILNDIPLTEFDFYYPRSTASSQSNVVVPFMRFTVHLQPNVIIAPGNVHLPHIMSESMFISKNVLYYSRKSPAASP